MNTDGLAKEVKILTAQNKVLRDALSEVNAKHAKELRVAKQKAANTARANAAAVQHEAASEANKQARRALLDAQKRIQTLSQRVKDKDEVLARSRASLRAQEDRSRDLQHQLQLLKDHVANKDDDPVTAATLENEDLKSELAVLRRKNDRLQEAAAAEAQNAEQLQRRLARFRDDLIKKDEEVFQLEKEIASLRRTSTGGNPSPARPLPAPPSSNDSVSRIAVTLRRVHAIDLIFVCSCAFVGHAKRVGDGEQAIRSAGKRTSGSPKAPQGRVT